MTGYSEIEDEFLDDNDSEYILKLVTEWNISSSMWKFGKSLYELALKKCKTGGDTYGMIVVELGVKMWSCNKT